MAEMGWHESLTLKAAADLRTFQYSGVLLSAANTCNVSSNADDETNIGVLLNKPNINEHAQVGIIGRVKVRAAGAITAGDQITTAGSGMFTGASAGDMIFGMALEAAGAANDIVSALIWPPYDNGNIA